jgi:hypothetical protein
LANRAEIREAFEPLLEKAADAPGYAGAYTDHARGGLPVLLTSEGEAFRAAIKSLPDPGISYEIRDVEYSMAQLEAIQDKVTSASESLSKSGTRIVSVGLDAAANRVVVGVQGLTDDSTSALSSEFGPAVTTTEERPAQLDACTNMTSCWPMKGGLKIFNVGNPSVRICTAGYIVAKSDTGALGMITAGHCLEFATESKYWGHANSPTAAQNVGSERLETWAELADADVGLIMFDLDTVAALGAPNAFHYADNSGNGTVVSVRAIASQITGDPVCRMGWGTWNATGQGRTCGMVGAVTNATLLSCRQNLNVDCHNIKHQWTVDFDSTGGDSGGPVYRVVNSTSHTYQAYGTHVHSDPDPGTKGWYSPVDWGRIAYSEISGTPAYNYDICITSSC